MTATSGQFLQSILDLPQPSYQITADAVFEDQAEDECSSNINQQLKPIQILTRQILPTLLPCINQLLTIVKQDKEYEREKLNSINWMVEFLYKNNPKYKEQRQNVELLDIPFVHKILAKRPQAPLPLHLRLTKGEAATLIQAGVRGYMARQVSQVQGFREKIKRKQAAAIVIQSAWRGHKTRVSVQDMDLSTRDTCNLYYNIGNKSVEPGEEGEVSETATQ